MILNLPGKKIFISKRMILSCYPVISSSARDKKSFKNNLRNTLMLLKSDAAPLCQLIRPCRKVTITDGAHEKDLKVEL